MFGQRISDGTGVGFVSILKIRNWKLHELEHDFIEILFLIKDLLLQIGP